MPDFEHDEIFQRLKACGRRKAREWVLTAKEEDIDALFAASALQNRLDLVELFIAEGKIKPSEVDLRLMMQAYETGSIEVVQMLRRLGADPKNVLRFLTEPMPKTVASPEEKLNDSAAALVSQIQSALDTEDTNSAYLCAERLRGLQEATHYLGSNSMRASVDAHCDQASKLFQSELSDVATRLNRN